MGVGDSSITQENMKTIANMSPEEIKQAQMQILEALGGEHSGALEKFKSNFGKKSVGKKITKNAI